MTDGKNGGESHIYIHLPHARRDALIGEINALPTRQMEPASDEATGQESTLVGCG